MKRAVRMSVDGSVARGRTTSSLDLLSLSPSSLSSSDGEPFRFPDCCCEGCWRLCASAGLTCAPARGANVAAKSSASRYTASARGGETLFAAFDEIRVGRGFFINASCVRCARLAPACCRGAWQVRSLPEYYHD